ncbi:hypothetical protein PLICRDRAFT_702696, partial [Plicaturopsis crispa FD-325 SS-3]
MRTHRPLSIARPPSCPPPSIPLVCAHTRAHAFALRPRPAAPLACRVTTLICAQAARSCRCPAAPPRRPCRCAAPRHGPCMHHAGGRQRQVRDVAYTFFAITSFRRLVHIDLSTLS